mmetsp:Transcript_139234/g.388560  ORF Transcript_139234/g.388560 Transcript_139234/m.388560 type:complete len:328 (+) Transcript_139234:244-1227(+)
MKSKFRKPSAVWATHIAPLKPSASCPSASARGSHHWDVAGSSMTLPWSAASLAVSLPMRLWCCELSGVEIVASSSTMKPQRPVPSHSGWGAYFEPRTRLPWGASMVLAATSDLESRASLPMKQATSEPMSCPKMRAVMSFTGTALAAALNCPSHSPALAALAPLPSGTARTLQAKFCCASLAAVSFPGGCCEALKARQKRLVYTGGCTPVEAFVLELGTDGKSGSLFVMVSVNPRARKIFKSCSSSAGSSTSLISASKSASVGSGPQSEMLPCSVMVSTSVSLSLTHSNASNVQVARVPTEWWIGLVLRLGSEDCDAAAIWGVHPDM